MVATYKNDDRDETKVSEERSEEQLSHNPSTIHDSEVVSSTSTVQSDEVSSPTRITISPDHNHASIPPISSTAERQPTRIRFLSAALLVIISASAGFGGGWLGNHSNTNENQVIQKQQVVLKNQGQLISTIASRVSPSVVSVEVTGQSQVSSPLRGLFDTEPQQQTQQSAGTGIIIDKGGLIVTNRHVVPTGTQKVSVTLSDGTKFDNVQVVGRTSESDPLDVAFLKITDTKGKNLSAVTLGDSGKVGIGDSVIAIGNALGQFQNSVTSGIISGHGRSVQAGDASGGDTENLENLFQTDAAINEGNSGGPLVNLEGEVIGVNTAVAGDAQNIGFSIPINDIKGVINTVLAKGKLERPYLGVQYVPITAEMAKRYNLDATQGVYIPPAGLLGSDNSSVISGGPASKAGVKEGDIITKVDADTIDESHSLTSLLGKHQVGDKVTITIIRDKKPITVTVTLEAAPQN